MKVGKNYFMVLFQSYVLDNNHLYLYTHFYLEIFYQCMSMVTKYTGQLKYINMTSFFNVFNL